MLDNWRNFFPSSRWIKKKEKKGARKTKRRREDEITRMGNAIEAGIGKKVRKQYESSMNTLLVYGGGGESRIETLPSR